MPFINPDKPFTHSHLYTLRRLQKAPIGARKALELKKGDIIEHCKTRRASGVLPQTINQDVTYLRGPLKFAGSAWDDCEDVSDAAIAAAMPMLKKYSLIGKSRPRDRRPLQEELDIILAFFDEQNKLKRTKTNMRVVVEFALLTARRISETCRLRWGDVNGADMTCIVRDMKDPKQKKGNDHEFPLIGRAWDIVMAQPRETDDPNERVFKYNPKTCSQRYTLAKKVLAKRHPGLFENLRLHDCRREAASRFIEGHESFGGEAHSIPQAMVLTGHKNPNVLTRTYMKLNARDLHPKKQAPTAIEPATAGGDR